MINKTETEQLENRKNDETLSSVDKTTQNNSKELFKSTDELAGKSKRSREKKRVFSLLDILISVSIIAPLVIGFWRGVWNWINLYPKVFPFWFTFIFGVALSMIFTICKNRCYNIYTNKKWTELNSRERLFYRTSRILYTYIFGVACIMHWQGGWGVIDNFLFIHIWITTSLTCLILACLAVLRCIRNLMHVPFLICIDTPRCFLFPTRYNMLPLRLLSEENSRLAKRHLHIAKCTLSVIANLKIKNHRKFKIKYISAIVFTHNSIL